MNDWIVLGIEKTDDLRKVKQAYAEKTKLYHPETHPEEFQKLYDAYKRISAQIRNSANYQQQLQVHKPDVVREAEKQLEVAAQDSLLQKESEISFYKEVHKPVRDTKQDEDFLQQVEDAAKNFEMRHTDKKDPVQVAKVDYILQHDDKNSKLLQQFQWLLYNEFSAKGWRTFFVNREFLERQYEPEFINGMTEILKSRILEIQRAKKGSYGLGVLEYFIIVYGPIFEEIEHLQLDDHIYQKKLLGGLADTFPANADKRAAYQQVESNETFLGERYAFFLYRRILEELDADIPDKVKIKEVIIKGFQKTDISTVFYDLIIYLIFSNRKNIQIFKAALERVCEMEWGSRIQDEIEIIKLELQEAERKSGIQTTEMQTGESVRMESQTSKRSVNTIEKRKKRKQEEEEKFNKTIGKWMFRIAAIILCLNVLCRIIDAVKSMEYVQVMGTVTSVDERTEYRAGKRSYIYSAGISYQPRGWRIGEYIVEHVDMLSEGDTVPVLYRKDAVWEAYAAKKDWMTGAYLPISKWYNVPFVISIVLFVIGFLMYTNSPILEWYTRAGEITIGKKRVVKKGEAWSYKQRGWISAGRVMIAMGIICLLVFLGCLRNSFNGGDYFSLMVLFLMSMLFIVPGIRIIRWAQKNGKE